MLSALNFCGKAAADLRHHPFPRAPLSRAGSLWVADMLDRSEVFVLPDGGRLLDRTKPKPEVPGIAFKPAFPVTALEYVSTYIANQDPLYQAVRCPKRIALAWDWTADVTPPMLRRTTLEPGVGIISVFYVETARKWMCNSVAMHLPYDGRWHDLDSSKRYPFQEKLLTPALMKARGYTSNLIPILPEVLQGTARAAGSPAGAIDIALSDNNDELVAYVELCYALACNNVTSERLAASKIVNGRKRRPDLRDFHVLSVDGELPASELHPADRIVRSHLRRGHLRRIRPDGMTWVNQTLVRGRSSASNAEKTVEVAA